MKFNLILIGLFFLALIVQMKDFKAVKSKQYRLSDRDNGGTYMSREEEAFTILQPPSVKVDTRTEKKKILSEHEMKLIDKASAIAFERLKKFFVIASRSRFG
jgi:hypothetical protein